MHSSAHSSSRFVRAIAAIASVSALLGCDCASALTQSDALSSVSVRELPREARQCLDRIRHGGPFPFDRDGVAFGNRERLLPPKARGYYLEYTVATPGERSRGARRIVCGGPPRSPDACYYTDDHYRSFRKIRE